MIKLETMINIGHALAERMYLAGINSAENLIDLGSKEAFIRVKTVYPDACINHLYALEGAVQNIRWHHLLPETKKELKEFYDNLN